MNDNISIGQLPVEILLQIMSHLSLDDLFALRIVSPYVYDVAGSYVRRRHVRSLLSKGHNHVTNVTNVKLQWLLSNMPDLQCINLGRVSPKLEALDLDIVARNIHGLRKIDLRRFHVDKQCLERLCINCPKLMTVVIPRELNNRSMLVEVLKDNLLHLFACRLGPISG